jgi:hypothetical protein
MKKAMAVVSVGYALKYGAINANADLFVNYTQPTNNQKIETVHDDFQSLTEADLNNCNCSRVKTSSGAVLAFSKDIPAETVVPETIMVKNNSSSPITVPGVARGFVTQPQVNRPAGAGRVNPGQPARTPQFHIPHGIIKDQPVTGARQKQTELGASKARQNSYLTKGKKFPKSGPIGSNPTEMDDANPSVKAENQEQYNFVNKKNKNKSGEQCELDGNVKAEKNVVYRIKKDFSLVGAAKEACKNADVQKDVNHLEEQLVQRNENPGIGRKPICRGIIEHRGKNGGRLYVREADGVIEILAKSGKNKKNQQFVINRLKEIYD